jgi:hypothetical protein
LKRATAGLFGRQEIEGVMLSDDGGRRRMAQLTIFAGSVATDDVLSRCY